MLPRVSARNREWGIGAAAGERFNELSAAAESMESDRLQSLWLLQPPSVQLRCRELLFFHCGPTLLICATVARTHSAFHGIAFRSSSWNSADAIRPRKPMVTIPTNMVSTWRSSHEF